ncbi:MAG: hypothetical protein LC660_11090 [Desulfobacteraceae bacterium]|nr:hypothetical protein [Desulfobacteraceae bacterium]
MVFDYKILPVRDETIDAPYRIRGFSERRRTITRKFRRDRRKAKADRRSSVREGIFVELSFQNNRRKGVDRRNVSGDRRKSTRGSGARSTFSKTV